MERNAGLKSKLEKPKQFIDRPLIKLFPPELNSNDDNDINDSNNLENSNDNDTNELFPYLNEQQPLYGK